jgi:hypothetical protein
LAVAETAHVDLSLPDISVQTIETLIKYELERLFWKKRPKPRKKVSERKTFPKQLTVTYSDVRDPTIVEKSDYSKTPRSAKEDCHGYPVQVSAYWLLRHRPPRPARSRSYTWHISKTIFAAATASR